MLAPGVRDWSRQSTILGAAGAPRGSFSLAPSRPRVLCIYPMRPTAHFTASLDGLGALVCPGALRPDIRRFPPPRPVRIRRPDALHGREWRYYIGGFRDEDKFPTTFLVMAIRLRT